MTDKSYWVPWKLYEYRKHCLHNLLCLLPLNEYNRKHQCSIISWLHTIHRYFRHRSRVGQQITKQSTVPFRIEMRNLVAIRRQTQSSNNVVWRQPRRYESELVPYYLIPNVMQESIKYGFCSVLLFHMFEIELMLSTSDENILYENVGGI